MNKTALITGASRGIGRAMAETFAAAGYDLVLTCLHHMEELEKLGQELESAHSVGCRCFTADAGDWEAITALFSHIRRLDVLINNAGIAHIPAERVYDYADVLTDQEEEDLRRT